MANLPPLFGTVPGFNPNSSSIIPSNQGAGEGEFGSAVRKAAAGDQRNASGASAVGSLVGSHVPAGPKSLLDAFAQLPPAKQQTYESTYKAMFG